MGTARMDRLQLLIFSFYREDPRLEERLEPLRDCRMRRSWGSIRIDCHDLDHLEEVSDLLEYLRLPPPWLGTPDCGSPGRGSVRTRCMFPFEATNLRDSDAAKPDVYN